MRRHTRASLHTRLTRLAERWRPSAVCEFRLDDGTVAPVPIDVVVAAMCGGEIPERWRATCQRIVRPTERGAGLLEGFAASMVDRRRGGAP